MTRLRVAVLRKFSQTRRITFLGGQSNARRKRQFHPCFSLRQLPLLCCVLLCYLWTISRTIAGVTLAITLSGFTLYVFLTLLATFYHNCLFQTPPSSVTRTTVRYLSHMCVCMHIYYTPSARWPVESPIPKLLQPMENVGLSRRHLSFNQKPQ